MAKENAWGYARIGGELKKLGVVVANNTIKKTLIINGFHPSPWRTKGDWDRFIRLHMETLWATDFFTKDIWTAGGKVTFYVLFFIHVGSRRVHISGATCSPTGAWVEQQARNLVMDLQDRGEKVSYLLRDGDTKFTQAFDEVFKSEGIKVKKLPRESPNLNAFAERLVQTIKNECLRHFVVFGQKHLEFLLREFASYYNTVRPHQGIANRTIGNIIPFPTQAAPLRPEDIQCDSKLGGLLRHYSRKAA
ncbi:integrase [Verrucomicrobia bacterium LW23]|nr:integrase [Verrucomicrobia bacterium LW23]